MKGTATPVQRPQRPAGSTHSSTRGLRPPNPPQYFCLENFMDRGVWQATVHEVAKSQTKLCTYTDFHFRGFQKVVMIVLYI